LWLQTVDAHSSSYLRETAIHLQLETESGGGQQTMLLLGNDMMFSHATLDGLKMLGLRTGSHFTTWVGDELQDTMVGMLRFWSYCMVRATLIEPA
jgi:hypothetical protein